MSKRRKRKQQQTQARFQRPTSQRETHNTFRSAGPAVRLIPPIETLHTRGKLTQAEYDALKYYDQQAAQAEDDAKRTSPMFSEHIGGGGDPIPVTFLATPAMLETARIEHDLGPHVHIARFVVLGDHTLTEWCIWQHGGRERYDRNGNFIAMVPNREREVMAEAVLHLKQAARKISP